MCLVYGLTNNFPCYISACATIAYPNNKRSHKKNKRLFHTSLNEYAQHKTSPCLPLSFRLTSPNDRLPRAGPSRSRSACKRVNVHDLSLVIRCFITILISPCPSSSVRAYVLLRGEQTLPQRIPRSVERQRKQCEKVWELSGARGSWGAGKPLPRFPAQSREPTSTNRSINHF